MKFTLTCLALALAAAFSTAALAQGPSNAESVPPGTAQPAPKAKATVAEKAQGKAQRKVAGTGAAKEDQHAEGDPRPGSTDKVAKTERQAARADRKAETRRANLAGEITSKGETGVLK